MTNFEKMRYLHRSAGKVSAAGEVKKKTGRKAAGISSAGNRTAAQSSGGKGAEDEERSSDSGENV